MLFPSLLFMVNSLTLISRQVMGHLLLESRIVRSVRNSLFNSLQRGKWDDLCSLRELLVSLGRPPENENPIRV